jgi:CRISPR-associated Cas5-like protein
MASEGTPVLRCVVQGSFCSFRVWDQARYQSTYWLPPKTTVVGFLAAALGLSEADLADFYDRLLVSAVLEEYRGFARDLWQFTKLKKNRPAETAVTVREALYLPRYSLYFSSSEVGRLEEFQQALEDPRYPLRFGRSDDLARLVERPTIVTASPARPFGKFELRLLRWTLMRRGLDQPYKLVEVEPGQRLRPPQEFRLPLRFRPKGDGSRRTDSEQDWARFTAIYNWALSAPDDLEVWSDGRNNFCLF